MNSFHCYNYTQMWWHRGGAVRSSKDFLVIVDPKVNVKHYLLQELCMKG